MGKQVIIWALGFFLLGASASWAEDIVVIVNNNVVVNSLTAQEIKDIYLGETEYLGNEQVARMGVGLEDARLQHLTQIAFEQAARLMEISEDDPGRRGFRSRAWDDSGGRGRRASRRPDRA